MLPRVRIFHGFLQSVAILFTANVSMPESAQAGFERLELQVPGSVLGVTEGDLDGDRRTDLVVTYRRGAGPTAQRFVAVFFRGETGYSPRPDSAFLAPAQAVTLDVGDVTGDASDELVYLTASGVLSQRMVARKPTPPERLLGASTLVLAPEEDDLVLWDFLKTQGKPEVPTLLIPTRRELRLYRRDGESWKLWTSCELNQTSYYDAESGAYRRSGRGGSTGRPYAFRVTTVVPNIDFVEQSGDGRIDLVAHFEDRIAVYTAGEDGKLSEKPSVSQWLGMRSPEELESRDSEVSAQVAELDGDGIADLVLTKVSGGITTLRTETRIHLGKRGGGFSEKAAQSFADEGFAALLRFEDVDGDGALEMIHPKSEVSVIALSRAMLASKLDVDVRIRRRAARPRLFETEPAQTLETTFGLDLTVGAALRGSAPIFGADFDGDGRRDAILSQGGDRMVLHRGEAKGDRLFEDEGKLVLSAPGTNTTMIVWPESNRRGRPELLLYYVAHRQMSGKLVVFRNRK